MTSCHAIYLQVHRSEVVYHGRRFSQGLKSAVMEQKYPPAIRCVVMYDSPPDCSRVTKKKKLKIKGTSQRRIAFNIKVYAVKCK